MKKLSTQLHVFRDVMIAFGLQETQAFSSCSRTHSWQDPWQFVIGSQFPLFRLITYPLLQVHVPSCCLLENCLQVRQLFAAAASHVRQAKKQGLHKPLASKKVVSAQMHWPVFERVAPTTQEVHPLTSSV
jgi:hypothetical protein